MWPVGRQAGMDLRGMMSLGKSLDLILRTLQPGLASLSSDSTLGNVPHGALSPLHVGLIPVTPIPDQDRSAGEAYWDDLWALDLVGLSPCWGVTAYFMCQLDWTTDAPIFV